MLHQAEASYPAAKQMPVVACLLGFLFFLCLHVAPFLWHSELNLSKNVHAQHLLVEALKVNNFRLDFFLNILGHLLLVSLYYLFLFHVARNLHRTFGGKLIQYVFISALLGWLLICFLNVSFFPKSTYLPTWPVSSYYLIGGITFLFIATYLASLIKQRAFFALSGILVLTVASVATFHYSAPHVTLNKELSESRNIIIIGVDSLSPVAFEMMKAKLPNMAGLADRAVQFNRAYTPLARTCPSWTSILSGKLPIDHGNYFNLRDHSLVERQDLLTHDLRRLGYRTLFAIDERRFCNIDESFGFDRTIGPKAGMLDFLVQRYNDTPLTNLFLQFELSRWLFPYSYMNVASHNNYNPNKMVDHISEELSSSGRVFLATHFLAAHYPYKIPKNIAPIVDPASNLAKHSSAMKLVDDQIGQLMKSLSQSGALNNALVILLSDHGEDMGEESAVMYKKPVYEDDRHGHGTDIASTWQNSVVLALSIYENGNLKNTPEISEKQTGLVDIRRFINHYVEHGEIANIESERSCLPVETGLRIFSAMNYKAMDYEEIMREGLPFYTVDSQGRMVLNEERLKELIDSKDFGVWCGDMLTFRRASQKETTYTLLREGHELREVDLDPLGVTALEQHINRYKEIADSLPDHKEPSNLN